MIAVCRAIQAVHLERGLEDLRIFVLAETGAGTRLLPLWDGVPVQREPSIDQLQVLFLQAFITASV